MELLNKKLFSLTRPLGKGLSGLIKPSLEALTDESLAATAAAGSADHFEALVRRYSSAMYRFAFRLCGNAAEAEDIVQETFIKVFRALPKARLDLPFKPWLYKIAFNTSLSSLRKRKGAPNVSWETAEPMMPMAYSSEGVVEKLDAQAAIERLPVDYRSIVILRAVEQLPFSEIGDILDIPEATARTRFKRAKDSLRTIIK